MKPDRPHVLYTRLCCPKSRLLYVYNSWRHQFLNVVRSTNTDQYYFFIVSYTKYTRKNKKKVIIEIMKI